jgi:hypothetical protein
VLKEIHKEMNVESVERLLEETQEARAYQQVSGVLTSINGVFGLGAILGNRRYVGEHSDLGRRRRCAG